MRIKKAMSTDKGKENVKEKQSERLEDNDDFDSNSEFDNLNQNTDYLNDKPVADVLTDTSKDESIIQTAMEATEEKK